jgi:hypothetical protein
MEQTAQKQFQQNIPHSMNKRAIANAYIGFSMIGLLLHLALSKLPYFL